MPSSLVFAALALAWIVVLVPMVARRRQEVRRTADSALAARVLRRGPGVRPEEVPDMPDDQYHDEPYADEPRRYRPGRGGFDPYAAELAARARYAFRQRVVLCLLLTAVAGGILAFVALPVLWWVHGAADAILVAYLVYLRRQVRIEQEIRQRRLDRAARTRRALEPRRADPAAPAHDNAPAPARTTEPVDSTEPPLRPAPRPVAPPGTAVVDLDDEDPSLCDLDAEAVTPYRRAAGE